MRYLDRHTHKNGFSPFAMTLPASAGQPIYELPYADAQGDLPAVLYNHGGGWVMGDRNTHDHLIRDLAVQTRAAVVFVEYGNAPEVRYPVNNEQACAVVEYAAANDAALGIDGARLAFAGDSAGGSMAIAVTIMAKDRAFGEGPCLTRKAMDCFLEVNFPAA